MTVLPPCQPSSGPSLQGTDSPPSSLVVLAGEVAPNKRLAVDDGPQSPVVVLPSKVPSAQSLEAGNGLL